MKSNQTVGVTIADDFSTITFTVVGHDPIVLNMDKLSPEVRNRAACVGMAQVRIVDAAAIPMTDKSGAIIPAEKRAETKHAKMKALVDHYETGTKEWSRVSEGGPAGGLLFEALCDLYKGTQTPEQVRTFVDGLTDKQQAALREDDTVAPVIARLKAERAAKKPAADRPDTKALLAGLTVTPPPADAAPTQAPDQTPAP